MADTSGTSRAHGARPRVAAQVLAPTLRTFAVSAGLAWAVAFVVIGLRFDLQLFADGSLFSYAVAAQDAWAFHWHNISGRVFVFWYAHLPAETYAGLFRDPHGGVVLYGFLFFVAPLLGLGATFAADKSSGRVIFVYACASTACLCPLVFGFPTEVWVAHALFWPTLAVCHYARSGLRGHALVFAALLAMTLSHCGAIIFSCAILMTLALRGTRDPAFLRAGGMFFIVMAVWTVIKGTLPPDDYLAKVLFNAAMKVFDPAILYGDLVLLLSATLGGYLAAFAVLRRVSAERAHIHAAFAVAFALGVYWIWFDHALHGENRYYLRTALLVLTPAFGLAAALQVLAAEDRLRFAPAAMARLLTAATGERAARVALGALAVVMLVHVVETVKFVDVWAHYTSAVRRLAVGTASDPSLGDERFVSARHIGNDLNRLSWFSTTQYLSVLVAPRFAPNRLVLDPDSNFFWLSCRVATANFRADRALSAHSRDLIRTDACLHRKQ